MVAKRRRIIQFLIRTILKLNNMTSHHQTNKFESIGPINSNQSQLGHSGRWWWLINRWELMDEHWLSRMGVWLLLLFPSHSLHAVRFRYPIVLGTICTAQSQETPQSCNDTVPIGIEFDTKKRYNRDSFTISHSKDIPHAEDDEFINSLPAYCFIFPLSLKILVDLISKDATRSQRREKECFAT